MQFLFYPNKALICTCVSKFESQEYIGHFGLMTMQGRS